MQELEIAKAAALAGGEVLAGYFRQGVAMRTKQACDFVSDADVEAERAIADVILQAFPHHAILGEEELKADINAEHLWIVDPLDGTTNFAHDIPHFAVSIAYYYRGEPIVGLVYNPVRNDWFHATKGGGAYGGTYGGETRLSVAKHASLSESLVGVGLYVDRTSMLEPTLSSIRDLFGQQIHCIRRFGSAALDLAHVASGLYGAYFEYLLSPWDFAAGRLIVEEAGGRVTNCRGEKLPLERSSILASNTLLHDAVQQIVAKHHP